MTSLTPEQAADEAESQLCHQTGLLCRNGPLIYDTTDMLLYVSR
jgi:hypothetical protein